MKTKLVTLAMAALFLAGCKTEYTGTVTVQEALRPNVKKGQNVLNPGSYNMTLTIKSKKKAEIEVKLGGRGNNPVIPLNIKNAQLPKENGPIVILGRNSGQPFDIRGVLETRSERGDLRRGREQCSETVPVRDCWGGPHGPRCGTRWENVWGDRDIEYYDVTYHRTFAAQLLNAKDQRVQGELGGSDVWSERRVTWSSRCYVRGPYAIWP